MCIQVYIGHTNDSNHADILGKWLKYAIRLACGMTDVTFKCTDTAIYRIKVIPSHMIQCSQYEIPKSMENMISMV